MDNTRKQILITFVLFTSLLSLNLTNWSYLCHLISLYGYALVCLFVSWQASKVVHFFSSKVDPQDKAVFITGCDTGFGHELAKQLSTLNYQVFAGVLFDQGDGADELRSFSSKIHVIKVDVTNYMDVVHAKEYVEKYLDKNRKFWALVNNAGIINFNGFEWGKENDESIFKDQIDVNLLGSIRTIKVFLPLLRKTCNSRIVNVGSKAGKLAMRGLGFYSVSKFGIRGLCDFLRPELKIHKINVSIIEPTTYGTQMGNIDLTRKRIQELWRETPKKLRDDLTEADLKRFLNVLSIVWSTSNPNIQQVINAMIDGVTSYQPKSCYSVSSLKIAIILYILEKLPIDIRELFTIDDHLKLMQKFK